MKFAIDQVAICPADPVAAKTLLAAMGAERWAEDHVSAVGEVFGFSGSNEADLAFNYDLLSGHEFEVLHYTDGDNWMNQQGRHNSVSHLGMHCNAEELLQWRAFFHARGYRVAQEVLTRQHTNPAIAGTRWYHYVIFDTKAVLGVDLKFIVRRGEPG